MRSETALVHLRLLAEPITDYRTWEIRSLMITFSPLRAAIVMCSIGTLLLTLLGRVGYLQTYGREKTVRRAERQQHQNEVLMSRRGSIYDCNGMLMAGTVQSTSL